MGEISADFFAKMGLTSVVGGIVFLIIGWFMRQFGVE